MDELDRLHFELVETLRRQRPTAMTERISIGELHERVIPYRRVRDAVGFRSNDDFETAFSRLVAGERGYLLGDPVMQEDVRTALADVLPDIRRHRQHRDERVWLNPATIPPPGDSRYAPPELRERTDRDPAAPVIEPAQYDEHDVAPAEEEDASTEGVTEPAAMPVEGASETGAGPETEAGMCSMCGELTPAGAAFCPFCGERLDSGSCRVCGAGLEATWRFCPECGTRRGAGPDPA